MWCLTGESRDVDPALPDGTAAVYWGLPLTDAFRHSQGRGGDAVLTFGRDPLLGVNTEVLRDGLPP
ncbi:hypothetical protein SMALB_2023 [Streptomyces malaysiensis]|uniref:Uncharacterized protein n=2 Tax=Streptomyces malaysiensis TaxID=92644 RepID=A0A7X5X1F3_STRMQ|nr:hypothetical protein [Streptomyces malaysiensis]